MLRPTVYCASLAMMLASPFLTRPLAAQEERDADRWMADCRDNNDDTPHVCVIKTASFRPSGTIGVGPVTNDAVKFVGWDRDSVLVEARITARASSTRDASEIADAIVLDVSSNRIRANGPEDNHWWISYVVHVPTHSDLFAQTQNGPIAVAHVVGRMDLEAVNGPIALHDVGGDVHARAQNGPLDIELTGRKWNGAGLDAETQNGPVQLSIPRNYAAHLETGTENGPLSVDMPLTVQGRVTRRITTDLNGGGPTVRAVTTNGPLTIGSD